MEKSFLAFLITFSSFAYLLTELLSEGIILKIQLILSSSYAFHALGVDTEIFFEMQFKKVISLHSLLWRRCILGEK